MARPKSGNKHADIRAATIIEFNDRGISGFSVNRVADKAGLSVGTVYRYFKNKDDLLNSIYAEVKQDIHTRLMDAAQVHDQPADRIKAMWFALLSYGVDNPHDFIFVEFLASDRVITQQIHHAAQDAVKEIHAELQNATAANILRPIPIEAIRLVLVAPAMQLARKAALSKSMLDLKIAQEVFDICWRAVAKAD